MWPWVTDTVRCFHFSQGPTPEIELLEFRKKEKKVKPPSRVRLSAAPWTVAHQAPPSLGFSRQEHWSGLPFPSPMHESEK